MYSVVIANYNYGKYLKEAIESALLVTDDVIVIDDASTDNSLEVIMKFEGKISYGSHLQNQGVSKSRNEAIRRAKYPYIICLDSDDILNPEIKNITPTTDLVAIGVQHFEGRNDVQLPPDNISLELLKQGNVMPVSSPFSVSTWRMVGGFREDLSGLEDYDFFVRCLQAGATISSVRQPLLNYRIHAGGRNVEATKNYQELYKQIWNT